MNPYLTNKVSMFYPIARAIFDTGSQIATPPLEQPFMQHY
jgi:hypothetical protein